MLALNLREIAKITGAVCKTAVPDINITEVCTDSRDVRPGCLFVALMGGRFDGHAFVRTAFERGAAFAVVQKDGDYGNDNLLFVKTTRQAFLDIAGLHRSRYDIPCVAVTGSVGKTSTREMVYAVISSGYRTLKTENNQNNEVGVPKTMLELDGRYEAMVLEFGMVAAGEIRELTIPAKPDVAIITSVGVSHIERLGSRENILKAKLEIVDGMRDGATLLLNKDNDMLQNLDFPRLKVIFYGIESSDADILAKNIRQAGAHMDFDIIWSGAVYPASIPCVGEHNVLNALAGFGAGVALGMLPEDAANALANFTPTGMRQRLVGCRGTTVVEDCYNANPDSMSAALKTLAGWKLAPGARRIAVLGDMLELGDFAEQAHLEAGRLAAGCCDLLLCCGGLAGKIAEGAASAGMTAVYSTGDKDKTAQKLIELARPGDIIWFKASRGMKFEDIMEMYYDKD